MSTRVLTALRHIPTNLIDAVIVGLVPFVPIDKAVVRNVDKYCLVLQTTEFLGLCLEANCDLVPSKLHHLV